LWLGHFAQNIARTFAADLSDGSATSVPDRSDLFEGLMRFDGSRKPAFASMSRLLALLADGGSAFSVRPLEYRFLPRPEALREVLLAKRDGRFELVLWMEVASFDETAGVDLDVPDTSVTLELAVPVARTTIHRPVQQEAPVLELSDATRVELMLPDDPLVIELSPAAP
jgi:hypothetical protein